MDEYLTEDMLGVFLSERFKKTPLKQYKINLDNFNWRYSGSRIVDYYIYDINTIIEFDGYRHYTETNQILKDYEFNEYCYNNNLNLIRIPYFIQFNDSNIINHIFDGNDINMDVFNNYKSGFIDKKATLPNDFCIEGIYRFVEYITRLEKSKFILKNTLDEIENSLNSNIKSNMNIGDLKNIIKKLKI